jgi:hypothetical protein
MALTLRLRSGGITPAPELQFDAARLVVGRAAGCELQLPDPSVSGRHASIRQRGSDYVVVDEGSDNGTFSGSEHLVPRAPHTLSDGELLRFGRVWVEVRLEASQATTDNGASRELARRLVEHALSEDEAPYGMTVTAEAAEVSLRLDKPRHPYVIGSQKSADLRLDGADLPGRAAELRRQGDQLWITLLSAEAGAKLDGRELTAGERVAWPRSAVLTLGAVRLTLADATAQILERVERGPTEALGPEELIEPPEGTSDDGAEGEPDDDEDEYDDDAGDEPEEAASSGMDSTGPARGSSVALSRARSTANPAGASRWTSLDAVVLALALGMLGLSLWAIRWLAHLGSA